MRKFATVTIVSLTAMLMLPAVVSAHVIVTPKQAGVGEELVFNVSVPNERTVPVTGVRLEVPKGVDEVTPTTTPGWTITTTGSGDNVSAITWTGTMPVGQREDFSFGAQMPANAGQLDWKAYQTYADGTVVHWDQQPSGSDDAVGTAGPFSVTKVVDDLRPAASKSSFSTADLALLLSAAALVLSIAGLFMQRKR